MQPIVVTQAGVGQSAPVPLDHHKSPFAVTLDAVVSGSATYNIEYTNDPLQPTEQGWQSGQPSQWTPVAANVTGATANQLATLGPNPYRAVRINQTAGTGSVTLRVIQAGLAR